MEESEALLQAELSCGQEETAAALARVEEAELRVEEAELRAQEAESRAKKAESSIAKQRGAPMRHRPLKRSPTWHTLGGLQSCASR